LFEADPYHNHHPARRVRRTRLNGMYPSENIIRLIVIPQKLVRRTLHLY
jgi:hypothetical protein